VIFVMSGVLLARFVLYSAAPQAIALPADEWSNQRECSAPLCLMSPDSFRYGALTTFALATGVNRNPETVLKEMTQYEVRLRATRDGVFFSYVSALLAKKAGLPATAANSVIELLGAVLGALVLRDLFIRLGLSAHWLIGAALSPVFTLYGNINLKEAWDVTFFLVLVYAIMTLGRGRRALLLLVLCLFSLWVLYYDRTYYILLALFVGLADRVVSEPARSRRTIGYAMLAGIAVAAYELPGLDIYRSYRTVSGGRELLRAVAHTMLDPIGLHNNLFQYIVLAMTLPVFMTYLVVLFRPLVEFRTRRTEAALRWARRGWMWVLTFVVVVIVASRAQGSGFERGRDAFAPLLLIGAAMLGRRRSESDSNPRVDEWVDIHA